MRSSAGSAHPITLAPAQEGQWEHACALSPGDPGRSHHIVMDNRRLAGTVDRLALWQAFADVTARHDALRLTFDAAGYDPVIRIREAIAPPVEFLDLSGLSARRQHDRLADLGCDEAQRCFDLGSGPLWHAWVIRLGAESHLISVVFFHIIADGWSSKVFVEDLLAAYGARTGANPPPCDDALSFAEIHALQGRRLAARADRLQYWREQLAPLPRGPLLPPTAGPDADPRAHSTMAFRLPAATAAQLRRVAWQARTTPYVALMAAYHLLLSMLAGWNQTVVSTASLGRPTRREKRAILQFACDPYVSTELPDSLPLLHAVRATHAALTTAVSNLTSYKAIARAVNPQFGTSRPWPDCHLFDGNFFSWAFTGSRLRAGGLLVERVRLPVGSPARQIPQPRWADLSDAGRRAWATRGAPSLEVAIPREAGWFHYNPEIYPAELVEGLASDYERIVEAVVWHPGTRVGALRERHARQKAAALP